MQQRQHGNRGQCPWGLECRQSGALDERVTHAPDGRGAGFFRATLCGTSCVPASPVGCDITTMVETRIADYVRYFERTQNRRFDIWHGQDGISGNALATLKERTVVHCPVAVDRIITAVSEYFAVPVAALLGSSREKVVSTARAVAMHLANPKTDVTDDELKLLARLIRDARQREK